MATDPRKPIAGMPGFGRQGPDPTAGNARAGDRLIAIFLMGAVLLHPLLVGVFDAGPDRTVFGIPLLFAYLFVLWGALIAGLRFALRPDRPAPPRVGPPRVGPPRPMPPRPMPPGAPSPPPPPPGAGPPVAGRPPFERR